MILGLRLSSLRRGGVRHDELVLSLVELNRSSLTIDSVMRYLSLSSR